MRTDIPTFDELFFGIARLAGSRSKDPSTQNGACIVDDRAVVRGVGYNGFPRGVKDTPERWERPTKYDMVEHSERNAIHNSEGSLVGCHLYLWSEKNYLPCAECTKAIIQVGIKCVHILGLPDWNPKFDWNPTRLMLGEANVEMVVHESIDVEKIFQRIYAEEIVKNK